MDESLSSIAHALVGHCRAGTEERALATLYAADAVSVEGVASSGGSAETRGVDGIAAKHAWWAQAFEVLSSEVEGPFTHAADRFAVTFSAETRNRQTGEISARREVAVYTLENGKIVREEFYYAA